MKERFPALLLAVLLGGLAIRVVAGVSGGVYVDEAYAYFISRSSLHDIIVATRPDFNMPAWYLFLHMVASFTRSPILLRLPSILFASAAVYCIHQAATRLHSKECGLATAALAASSYACWISDTQMRAYGLLTLACACAFWQFAELVDARDRRGNWKLYAAACIVMPMCHYLGAVLDGVLVVCALLPGDDAAPETRRRLALWGAVGLGCSAAWFAYSISGATNEFSHPHPHALHFSGATFQTPGYLSGVLAPLFRLRGADLWMPWFVPLFNLTLWAFAAYGVRGLAARSRRGACLVALGLLVPLLAFTVMDLVSIQPFQPRYLANVAWLFFLPLCVGLRAALPGFTVCVVAVNLLVAALYPFTPYFWNQDWRAVARFVEQREQPGDQIVFFVGYSIYGFDFYYHPDAVSVDFSHPGTNALTWSDHYTGLPQIGLYTTLLNADLDRRLGSGHVFLILNQENVNGGAQRVLEWFSARFGYRDELQLPSLFSWGITRVLVLERRPSAVH